VPKSKPIGRKRKRPQPFSSCPAALKYHFKWPALARIKNDIEPVFVTPRVDYPRDQLLRSRVSRQSMQLSKFMAPDILKVFIFRSSSRPDTDQYGIAIG